MKKQNKRPYELIYKKGVQLVNDYNISEIEYFEYYQDGCDPTFENYSGKLKIEVTTSDQVSFYDTAVNILKQGKALSIMTWCDFVFAVSEWIFCRAWNFSDTRPFKNNGMPLITIKTDDEIGEIKCVWLIKKFSIQRPVDVKIIRELGYLISQAQATKGIIVTTSRLTKGALKLIEENKYTMSYMDNEMFEKELLKQNKHEDTSNDLPF